jgi:hypothetical protein
VTIKCGECGERGHSRRQAEHPKVRKTDFDPGNGILICAVCDLPLRDHDSISMHELPELFVQRLRSSGVPWDDRLPVSGSGTSRGRAINE